MESTLPCWEESAVNRFLPPGQEVIRLSLRPQGPPTLLCFGDWSTPSIMNLPQFPGDVIKATAITMATGELQKHKLLSLVL